jgi:1,4-alpha-glucan branching enzyme
MQGYLALVLHAHLPFIRHPEHERFLEEAWLFEAVTETYLPLLQILTGWQRDQLPARLTLSLTPTLCAMLRDPLLQDRCERHLVSLVVLAKKEVRRLRKNATGQATAQMYEERFAGAQELYMTCNRDLVAAFAEFQEAGLLEIITCAATHGILPLLASHPPSVRGQLATACTDYADCFGCTPRGIWLPECAYSEAIEPFLRAADLRWFITDTHGLMHASPRPRQGVFAPIFTSGGLAVFGRDRESSRQVWSRTEGYPGDSRYRDFYRDIGFDLDFDYVKPHLPSPDHRGFTGFKYHRITGGHGEKQPYQRADALAATEAHAAHFLAARERQLETLAGALDRPPVFVSPYDAELFGHWWFEGPEFIDRLARLICREDSQLALITPGDYLRRHPTNQVATPAAASWGEEGHLKVWLNEKNEWIQRHLHGVQQRMTELARRFERPDPLTQRALQQAARELLLAQASDWPFIIHTGTSPGYARQRVETHLARFNSIYGQLTRASINEPWLREVETRDNLFPHINPQDWL